MRHRTRFRNSNNITAPDDPGECHRRRRAAMCSTDPRQGWIAHQATLAQRRIGHHRHAVPFAPWQQVVFNSATAEVAIDLIGRATIALWNAEQSFHLGDCKIGYAPGTYLASRA